MGGLLELLRGLVELTASIKYWLLLLQFLYDFRQTFGCRCVLRRNELTYYLVDGQ